MDENLELLQCVHENALMEVNSLTNLLNDIKEKDNKIKNLISEEVKGFEKFVKSSEKFLKKFDVKPKSKGIMAEVMSSMGIKKEVKSDNSDSAIAEMVIEGFTMGNLEIKKLISNYEKAADKKFLKLAQDLVDYGEAEIDKLKIYLKTSSNWRCFL